MKILFTGEYNDSGSAKAPLLISKLLYEKMWNRNSSNLFLTYFQDGKKYNRIKKFFGYEVIDDKMNIYRCGVFPLLNAVIKFKPDVVHLINFQMFYVILFPLKYFMGFKLVYSAHGIQSYELMYYRSIKGFQRRRILFNEWIIMNFADKILALSNLNARYIRYHFKVKPEKVSVISNGIDSAKTIIKEYPDKNEVVNAIVIGDINRIEKGVQFLIDVLKKGAYKMRLCVFGCEKDYVSTHSNLIVELKKHVDNSLLLNEILKFDIVFVPSLSESFSLSLLECMSAGLLFLAGDRVGLTERFDSKLNNFVFRHNNEKSFHEKLKFILNLDQTKKKQYSEHIKKFSEKFGYAEICRQHFEEYNKLCCRMN